MKSILFGVVLFFVTQFLYGQRDYYIPKLQTIAFHKGKNELHSSFGIGFGKNIFDIPYSSGLSLDLSYSLIDNLAFYTNFAIDNTSRNKTTFLGSDYFIKKNDLIYGAGIIYFTKINSFNYEFSLGSGVNNVDNFWYFINNNESKTYTQSRYYNFLFQQSFYKEKNQ